jgi:hypothetical protein
MSKNTIIRTINDIVGRRVNTKTMNASTKLRLVSENINTSRYGVTLVNSSAVALTPRFHNKRDSKGRFARIVR